MVADDARATLGGVLHTLDHVVIAVRDLDEATDATAALLGRTPSWRGTHPGEGTSNALFRLDNTYLELLTVEKEVGVGAVVAATLAERGEGVFAVAFGTDDADACAEAWQAAGAGVLGVRDGEGADAASGAVRRWRSALLGPDASRGLWLFAIDHRSPPDALPVRAPEGDPRACVAGLDHVVVLSPDLEASGTLYGERLGLRLALDRSFEARGLRMLFFRVGGVTVEVVGRLGTEPEPGAPDRFGGLAWRVPDADAARARLLGAGFDVSEVRAGHKPGTRVCTVRDRTHGVPTLLIEPSP